MYQSMMPPDMELFLCGWLRERLAEAKIDALVSNKEPDEAAPFTRTVIVVRDDGGPQLGSGVVFERGIGVSVVYGDRRADFEIMRLARLVYAWLTNPVVVMDEDSPIAWVDVDAGSNGPFRMVDEAGNARVYMTVEYHVTGELVEVDPPTPPPTGRITFTPSPLTLEEDTDATVTVTADGAPVPFDEALVSVGPDGVIEVYGGSGVWTVEPVAEGTATVAVSWTDPEGRAWEGVLPVAVEPSPAPLVFEAHPPILSMDEGETVGPVTFTLDGEPFPASSVAWETTGGHVRVSVTPDGTGCVVEGLTATGTDGYSIRFTPVNFSAEPATVTGFVYAPAWVAGYGTEVQGFVGAVFTVFMSSEKGYVYTRWDGSGVTMVPETVARATLPDSMQVTLHLDAAGTAVMTLIGLAGVGATAVVARARIAVTVVSEAIMPGKVTMPPEGRNYLTLRQKSADGTVADIPATAGRTVDVTPVGGIRVLNDPARWRLQCIVECVGTASTTEPPMTAEVAVAETVPLAVAPSTVSLPAGASQTLAFTMDDQPVPGADIELMGTVGSGSTAELSGGEWTITVGPSASTVDTMRFYFLWLEPVASKLPGGEAIGHVGLIRVTREG